jgi:hypothetical protein
MATVSSPPWQVAASGSTAHRCSAPSKMHPLRNALPGCPSGTRVERFSPRTLRNCRGHSGSYGANIPLQLTLLFVGRQHLNRAVRNRYSRRSHPASRFGAAALSAIHLRPSGVAPPRMQQGLGIQCYRRPRSSLARCPPFVRAQFYTPHHLLKGVLKLSCQASLVSSRRKGLLREESY